jgi:hypothetical protein
MRRSHREAENSALGTGIATRPRLHDNASPFLGYKGLVLYAKSVFALVAPRPYTGTTTRQWCPVATYEKVQTMKNAAKTTKAPKTAPKAPQATPAATPAPTYALSPKAAALAAAGASAGNTLQRPTTGLGMAWRAPGHKAPNTRALALQAVVAACGPTFTAAQAHAALVAAKAAGLHLGAGSPTSYVNAFIANGYFAPSA